MTDKQKATIQKNLGAFVANFGNVRIETADYGGGFYVFYPASSDGYIQFCPDINYLDGWLYGVVQGVNRTEFHQREQAVPDVYVEIEGGMLTGVWATSRVSIELVDYDNIEAECDPEEQRADEEFLKEFESKKKSELVSCY